LRIVREGGPRRIETQGAAEQFERPDNAQSCSRAAAPNTCASTKPAPIRSTINRSPTNAARRGLGAGWGRQSRGFHLSGFFILYLLHDEFHNVPLADKSSLWRDLSIKCRPGRGACTTISVGSRYASVVSASTGRARPAKGGFDRKKPSRRPGRKRRGASMNLTLGTVSLQARRWGNLIARNSHQKRSSSRIVG
jgi:hypothetical protein